MKLLICTPSRSLWTPEYGHSLAWTMSELASADNGITQVAHNWMDGTLLSGLRKDLAQHAIDMKASHILWTDDDMKFGPGNVNKLLEHSEKDIVGTNYIRRLPPHAPTAIGMNGQYLAPKARGLEKVHYTGMGLMLTKTSVFERLPQPWFLQPWDEGLKDTIGEDVWFCKLASDHVLIPMWTMRHLSVLAMSARTFCLLRLTVNPKLHW